MKRLPFSLLLVTSTVIVALVFVHPPNQLFSVNTARAVTPDQWVQDYGSNDNQEQAAGVVECGNGDFLIAGTTHYSGPWDEEIILMRVDSYGNQLWNRTYNSEQRSRAEALIQTGENQYLIVGATYNATECDVQVLQVNELGVIVWNVSIGGPLNEYPLDAVPCSDGGAVIVGSTYPDHIEDRDLFAYRISSTGSLEWNLTYDGGGFESAYDVYQCSDGSFLLAGYYRGFDLGSLKMGLVMSLNSTGDIEWVEHYSRSTDFTPLSIAETPTGGFIIGGYVMGDFADQNSYFGIYDSSREEVYSQTYIIPQYNRITDIVPCSDGFLLVGVHSKYYGALVVRRIIFSGGLIWDWAIGVRFRDYGGRIFRAISCNSGGFFLAGRANVQISPVPYSISSSQVFAVRILEFPLSPDFHYKTTLLGYSMVFAVLFVISLYLLFRRPSWIRTRWSLRKDMPAILLVFQLLIYPSFMVFFLVFQIFSLRQMYGQISTSQEAPLSLLNPVSFPLVLVAVLASVVIEVFFFRYISGLNLPSNWVPPRKVAILFPLILLISPIVRLLDWFFFPWLDLLLFPLLVGFALVSLFPLYLLTRRWEVTHQRKLVNQGKTVVTVPIDTMEATLEPVNGDDSSGTQPATKAED